MRILEGRCVYPTSQLRGCLSNQNPTSPPCQMAVRHPGTHHLASTADCRASLSPRTPLHPIHQHHSTHTHPPHLKKTSNPRRVLTAPNGLTGAANTRPQLQPAASKHTAAHQSTDEHTHKKRTEGPGQSPPPPRPPRRWRREAHLCGVERALVPDIDPELGCGLAPKPRPASPPLASFANEQHALLLRSPVSGNGGGGAPY
jgi:hypothetical protein